MTDEELDRAIEALASYLRMRLGMTKSGGDEDDDTFGQRIDRVLKTELRALGQMRRDVLAGVLDDVRSDHLADADPMRIFSPGPAEASKAKPRGRKRQK